MSGVYVETDPGKPISSRLLTPHYSDGRFERDQTVFLAKGYHTVNEYGAGVVKGVYYNYSDRLQMETSSKDYNAAWEEARKSGLTKDCAAYYQEFLRELFHDPELVLVHIITGVNVSYGSAYRVYGYIPSSKSSA